MGFVVEPGLRLELVTSEPLVESPCALAFDARGRMFVAENRGYPTGPVAGEPPLGRIAMLEDPDGDGTYDKRTEFAIGLTFPNGVMPWRDGLLVTCAPEVLYLADSDGDGRADVRRVVLTGFSTAGSTQLRGSHPTLAIDNWVYITSGLTGGKIASPLMPTQPPVEVGRTDVRFQPDTGVIEAWPTAARCSSACRSTILATASFATTAFTCSTWCWPPAGCGAIRICRFPTR